MTVLNYKDFHFNLVVEKDSMVAQSGTLSFQRKTAGEARHGPEVVPGASSREKIQSKMKEDSGVISSSSNISGKTQADLETRITILEKALAESLTENIRLKEIKYPEQSTKHTTENNKVLKIHCSECNLPSDSYETLKKHMETIHFNFSHKCSYCGKGFNQKMNLVSHMRTHNEKAQSDFSCNACEINFSTEKLLTEHILKQHPKVQSSFICEKCQEQYETKDALEMHSQNAHKNVKEYNCNECDHQTTDSFKLKKHTDLAHNQFQGLEDKNISFYCVSCGQGFQEKSSLVKHRLDAHGKSKTKCRFKADKTCRNGANNGEQCLYDHSDNVQQENTTGLECNICKESFQYKSQFLKHRKSEHPETVPLCKNIKEGKKCNFGEQCGFDHMLGNLQQRPNPNVIPKVLDIPENLTTSSTPLNFWEGHKIIKQPNQLDELKQMMERVILEVNKLKQQIHK